MHDLNDLFFFAEVVERGGFAAAGRALGLPRSRLSRRLALLEEQLGVRLLNRTTRKLSLTAVGETYFSHCLALRDSAQAAADAVAQARSEPRGTIRVSCPVTLVQSQLGRLMPLYLARHPQVRVELEVSNRVVDLVQDGIDVALRVRLTLEDSASLVVKRLDEARSFLVASPALLERQGTPSTVEEAARLDSVSMSAQGGHTSIRLKSAQGQEADLPLSPRYVANDLLTLKLAVLGGTGMGLLPDYLCEEELRQGQLVRVLPEWTTPVGVLHAVFPTRRGLTPAVRSFLDFLEEHLASRHALSA
jgi:DNA-binding transcriptional LysR family regulator